MSSGHRWLQEEPPAPDRPSEIGRFSPARKDIPRSTQAENTPQFFCVYVKLVLHCTRGSIILHLSLSPFILTSVYFITLPRRGHSYPVKETMTLLFIF